MEAGAGARTHFRYPSNAIIDGMDVSADVMSKNDILHKKIIGDIQFYNADTLYDIIICWTVLEHVQQPDIALANMLSWVVDGGLIIIDVPNVLSLKGLITKYTPLWLHRWVYKHVFHFTNTTPFRTYLRLSLLPRRVVNFFKNNEILYLGFGLMTLRGVQNIIYSAIIIFLRVLSFGCYHPERAEFCIVVKKGRFDISAR